MSQYKGRRYIWTNRNTDLGGELFPDPMLVRPDSWYWGNIFLTFCASKYFHTHSENFTIVMSWFAQFWSDISIAVLFRSSYQRGNFGCFWFFFTYCLLYAGGKYKIDIVFEISVQVLYEKLQLGWQYYSYKSDLPGMIYLVYAKQNAKLKETEQGRRQSWILH